MDKPVITIGVDASTTCCGLAVFKDGFLTKTFSVKFKGKYDAFKLKDICIAFENVFEEYNPDIVIIEEPFTFSASRTNAVSSLNQVAGAIFSTAMNYTHNVYMIHNSTVKKIFGIKGKDLKDQMMAKAKELYDEDYKTQDEADAVLVVEAYKGYFK